MLAATLDNICKQRNNFYFNNVRNQLTYLSESFEKAGIESGFEQLENLINELHNEFDNMNPEEIELEKLFYEHESNIFIYFESLGEKSEFDNSINELINDRVFYISGLMALARTRFYRDNMPSIGEIMMQANLCIGEIGMIFGIIKLNKLKPVINLDSHKIFCQKGGKRKHEKESGLEKREFIKRLSSLTVNDFPSASKATDFIYEEAIKDKHPFASSYETLLRWARAHRASMTEK